MSRTSPTDPVVRGASVKSGIAGGGPRRAKTTYSQNQSPGEISSFNPHPMPAPGARPRPARPRPAQYQRVDPSPRGRVDPPVGNAAPHGPAYQPPGVSQGYGQGGYAPPGAISGPGLGDPGFGMGGGVGAAQMPVQGAQASPLLLALIAAMRGGYGY